jgi:hypothetical protein
MKTKNRAMRTWARVRQVRPRPWWVPVPDRGPCRVTRMTDASQWSLYQCLISSSWKEDRYASILIIRRNDDRRYAAAGFQVDLSCMGVKFAIGEFNVSRETIADLVELMSIGEVLEPCDPVLVAKILDVATDYADTLGLLPHEDYAWTRPLVGSMDTRACIVDIPTGQNGRPLFEADPGDNLSAVVNQLEAALGPNGFLFLAPLSTTPQG